MDLYLVRHGVAFDYDPAQWADDSQRPLTPDGIKRFKRSARGLKWLVPSVDLVLSSPWVRAWQTAELLRTEAGWPAPVAAEALAATGRAPAEVLQALQPYTASTAIALVGHEPSGGRTPRDFNIDPTGTFLLAANQDSDTVVTFRIDQATGKLSATGQVAEVMTPVCVAFGGAVPGAPRG